MPYPDALEPDKLHDSDLFRYQALNCRYRDPKLTETGEQIDEPLKLNDDFKQGLQMVYFKRLLSNIALTAKEDFNLRLEASTIFARPEYQADVSVAAQINRSYHAGKIRKEMEREGYDIFADDDDGLIAADNSINMSEGY